VTLILLAQLAPAQDFACSAPVPQAEVDADIDRAFAAAARADARAMADALNAVGPKMPCLEVAADRRSLARYGLLMSVASFFTQEEEAEIRWGLFARLTDPDVPWPEGFTPDHPLRQLIAEQKIPSVSGPEGKGLAPVKGGAIAINGLWTVEATAYAEIPTLVQVFDAGANPTTSYWQDGAAFPDWILGEPIIGWTAPRWTSDPAAARGKGGKVAKADKPKKQRDPIEIDWGPVLVTAGLAAGSGALFGLAAVNHDNLPDATTGDDLKRVRSNTNTLATLGVLSAAGAVGYATVQILVTDESLGFRIRW
jgi:hypothetical protein